MELRQHGKETEEQTIEARHKAVVTKVNYSHYAGTPKNIPLPQAPK
jgi:hypothetical protein